MKSKLFTSKEDKDEDKERVLSDEMKRTTSTQSGRGDKSGRLPKEIDWEHLDKSKFFLNGIGAFSLATLALYPLSVVKTRQMLEGTKIQTPFKDVVKNVIKDRGFKGLYAGFGTVVFGAIPLRMVYLSTLEYTKGNARALCEKYEVEEMYYGIADAAGGATASFVSQTLGTPIDIISQRLKNIRQVVSQSGSAEDKKKRWKSSRAHEIVQYSTDGIYAFGETKSKDADKDE